METHRQTTEGQQAKGITELAIRAKERFLGTLSKCLFPYLTALGPRRSPWDPCCDIQDPAPQPGIEPEPLHWGHRAPAMGPPGKSQFLGTFEGKGIHGVEASFEILFIVSLSIKIKSDL